MKDAEALVSDNNRCACHQYAEYNPLDLVESRRSSKPPIRAVAALHELDPSDLSHGSRCKRQAWNTACYTSVARCWSSIVKVLRRVLQNHQEALQH